MSVRIAPTTGAGSPQSIAEIYEIGDGHYCVCVEIRI